MANDSRLICAFGVIADVQYADIDDGMNFQRTRHRYYRRSLELVKTALRDWSTGQYRAEFVLQLGDLIDGRNARFGVSRLALDTVVSELIKCGHFVYHVIGNHDLYNLSHDELLTCDLLKASFINEAGISTPSPGSTGYYHFVPAEGFRIVVMDNYEISMLGQDETSDSYRSVYLLFSTNFYASAQHSMAGAIIFISCSFLYVSVLFVCVCASQYIVNTIHFILLSTVDTRYDLFSHIQFITLLFWSMALFTRCRLPNSSGEIFIFNSRVPNV